MIDEATTADPVGTLLSEMTSAALQIYCARAGEPIGGAGANKAYDQSDALLDAAKFLTLAKNTEWMRQAIVHAAVALDLPSIWPESGCRATEEPRPE